MSMLFSIISATRCRSVHHHLAVDALRFLEGPDAAQWRMLLLHHHDQYLKGAKAPDEVFKDFKNHVLHVRSGEWGGAIDAAAEWRKRTVRAMQEKDWAHTAWCAGVMSHYVVDPFQPFHTHQTEEENVIHRAVEWSFFKSYRQFQAIIERELGGYPALAPLEGDDWLAQMLRGAARDSTKHYETIVDHYNFPVGAKRPTEGLDETLRQAIAPLIARATVSWARVLDKLAAEAAVKPPRVGGALQAFFMTLETPIQKILAAIADSGERAQVAAQYEEFRKTGKVRQTLSEDETTVRALHAAEVLDTPLSSLDARWPREIGTAHAPGRRSRKAKSRSPAPAKAAANTAPAATPHPPPPADPAPAGKAARGKKAAARAGAPAPLAAPEPPPPPPAAPAPSPSPFFNPAGGAPSEPAPAFKSAFTEAPAPAPAPPPPAPVRETPRAAPSLEPEPRPLLLTKKAKKKRGKDAAPERAEFCLRGDSPVQDAPSIGPKTAKRFHAIGIRTVSDLLALSPATAAVLLNTRFITSVDVSDWQAEAVLACTLPNLKSREAQALVACGLADVEAIADADPKALAEGLRVWATSSEGQRAWGKEEPGEDDARTLIDRAKRALVEQPKTLA
ncbi:MAG: DUF4332 domain-containing protein [Alphaproteobacteria bacterium]|nr:DUF4332 domain-containing protein [Alphaproteobacteria bacterium]